MGQSRPDSRPKSGHALAMWRRSRAVQLATAGYSYDAIAREVGYANRGTAWRALDKALRDQVVEDVALYRRVQFDRLDRLLASLWPLCETGELKAFASALRTLDLQNKLLGLYEADEQDSSGYSIVQPDNPVFHAKVESDVPETGESLAG